MSLKAECQASLDALKTIIAGNVSSNEFVLQTILEDPEEAAIVPPVLMIFEEDLESQRPGAQWRLVLWQLRLQLFVQLGNLASAIKQCRDMRADLIEVLDQHLTLNGTCQVAFWKVPPKVV